MQRYTMIFITVNVLLVSSGSSAHHQELKIVYTASGICPDFSTSYRYCKWVVEQVKQLTHDRGKK